VTVLAPEAIAISHYLRRLLEPPLLEEIRARTADTAEKVRWMDDSERIFRNIPCPFLDGRGWCIIHPVRPLTCRALSSVDAGQCREVLDAQSRGEDEPLLVNLRQKLLMDETFRRIAAGLGRQGLDDRGYELAAAVATLLEQPGLPERFLAGEPKLLS
jgi:Fe-S-cluster containining protein